jgi:hypothetical protein
MVSIQKFLYNTNAIDAYRVHSTVDLVVDVENKTATGLNTLPDGSPLGMVPSTIPNTYYI